MESGKNSNKGNSKIRKRSKKYFNKFILNGVEREAQIYVLNSLQ